MESRVNFTSSLILEQHPMRNVKTKIKMQYYYVLEWFFDHLNPNELEKCRMELEVLTDIPVVTSMSRSLAARMAHLCCMSSTSGRSWSRQLIRRP